MIITKDDVKSLGFAINKRDPRPALKGVHVRPNGKTSIMEATDGHKLLRIETELEEGSAVDGESLISYESLRETSKLMNGSGSELSLNGGARLQVGKNQLDLETIDTKFPETDFLFESKTPRATFVVDVKQLADVCKALAPYSNPSCNSVVVEFYDSESGIVFRAKNPCGNTRATALLMPVRITDISAETGCY